MLPPPPTSLFYLNMANFLVEFALREGVTHITIVAGDLRSSCNGSHSFHGVQGVNSIESQQTFKQSFYISVGHPDPRPLL